MENASKALIIAAAVLIAIVLISFGLVLLNSGNKTADQAGMVGEEIESASQGMMGDIQGGLNSIGNNNVMLVKGTSFNKSIKRVNDVTIKDTNITKIVFDYWSNGYREGRKVLYQESDWENGTEIDEGQKGEIRYFRSDNGKTIYVLSRANIYANTSCSNMFNDFEVLKKIVFNNFKTSNVTDMTSMFRRCKAMETYDLSGFETKNVQTMMCMFENNDVLKEIDLSNFNTTNVVNMSCMFRWSGKLKKININGWNTINVENMSHMFMWCANVKDNIDLTELETSNVTDMQYMFYGCYNWPNINVSSFDTSKVENMQYMFGRCPSIKTLTLTNFNTSNVKYMQGMFYIKKDPEKPEESDQNPKLETLDLSSFDTSKVENMQDIFKDCTNLTTIYVGEKWKTGKVEHPGITFKN